MTTFISRRDLLKTTALIPVSGVLQSRRVGAADGGSTGPALQPETDGGSAGSALQAAAARNAPLESLTAHEMEILDAVAARLIPNDEHGPGAVEAGATRYIDRALAGPLASSRPAYTAGLDALDRYAESSRGKAFRELSPIDQDSVLIDVETGAATGFVGSSAVFFAMVRTHTLQGTFGDPFYGGNANFIGWDMIGYPGVRTNVSAEDQRLGVTLTPNHQSAYDNQMFNKASASAAPAATADKQASARPKPQATSPKPHGAHHGD